MTFTDDPVVRQMSRCAWSVIGLLARRRLHRDPGTVGSTAALPDGRTFTIFRDTSCDEPATGEPVTLAVWFRLKGVPAGAPIRRWIFERESILNTLLYAGFAGYRRKLWMVDPVTSEYAGLYDWIGAEAAGRYARYITAVLRPLSVPGSVGYQIVSPAPGSPCPDRPG
jgi:hypothetical protein